jgi:hypothetical protein
MSSEGEVNNPKIVYRGIHAGHPAMAEAERGMIAPGNAFGTIAPEDHNDGRVSHMSPYTSWTYNRAVAEFHARKSGPGGIVLQLPAGPPQPGDTWSWEWSPDRFGEQEVLLRGKRTGATVIPV